MKMQKHLSLILQAAYWALYESLCIFLLYLSHSESLDLLNDDQYTNLLLLNMAAVPVFYGVYFFSFTRYMPVKRIGDFVKSILLLSLAGGVLSTAVVNVLFYSAMSRLPGTGVNAVLLCGYSICALINAIAATAVKSFLYWWNDIRAKEILTRRNLESELNTLKAQLQPHFLFNTLNNIDVLIGMDPQKASSYLQQLSRMLRYVLYSGRKEIIPLEDEISFLQDYVMLQRIRKEDTSWIDFKVSGSAEGIALAPLLFQPYIENAFKYVSSIDGEPKVKILLEVEGNCVRFQCENSCAGEKVAAAEQQGIGLNLAAQRLTLLYQTNHRLEVKQTPGTFFVNCTIDL